MPLDAQGSAPPSTAGSPLGAPRPDPRLWRLTLLLTLVVAAIFGVQIFRPPAPWPDAVAPYFLGEMALAAAAGDGEGATATLPYRCPSGEDSPCSPVFRLTYRHDPDDPRPTSLYIPSFIGSVTVSLNGALLASSSWTHAPAELSSAVPMLVALPGSALRPGDNEIELALAKRGLVRASLEAVAIGPDALLRPDFDRRVLLFSTLQRMTDGWQLSLGIGLLIMWLARPREPIFLVTAGLTLSNLIPALPTILRIGSDSAFIQLVQHSRFLTIAFALPLAWMMVGERPAIPLRITLLLPLAACASFLALPSSVHWWLMVTVYLPSASIMIAVAIVVVFRAALRKQDIVATVLTGLLVVALLFHLHDILTLREILPGPRMLLGRFLAPIGLTALGAILIWRFARTLTQLDQFSGLLQREVADAEDALRQSFAREQAQARAATLQEERVRLMSDLHDGIAGQLVSIMALCELRGNAEDEITKSVGAALADLRLVVASLEDFAGELGVMLALFRERIERQLRAQGVTLAWRSGDLPEVGGLHPGATLNLYRLLQEASVNAARHSGADTLFIEAAPSPVPGRSVRLTVRDQGRGGAAARPGGCGFGNMQRRAAALGADLLVDSGPGGTTVTVDLPLRLP